MKRYGNKLAALLSAICLILSLSACGGSGDGDGGSDGGKVDPLAAAMANMENAESMDAKMVMDMDMEVAGETLETATTINASVFNDPMRMKADMTMDMGGYGDVSLSVYAETAEDGTIVMYMYDGMDGWYSQEVTTNDLSQYDVSSNMDSYISCATSFKQEGTEQTEGVSAYKYTGVITGEAMQEVMLSSGALDSLSTQMSLDESQIKDMLSDLGDIAVTLWIDEESLYPVRYDMDMTAIMDGMIGKMLETLSDGTEELTMSIPKMTISMTCSNFNNATDFTIPEEAKNA